MATGNKKSAINLENIHKDMTSEGIERSFKINRWYSLSKDQYSATLNDNFKAFGMAIRDRVVERWIQTQQRYHKQNLKSFSI